MSINSQKEIEEMAEIISAVRFHKTSTYIAEALYNAGYRKSTNLGEEIFAEIEKLKYNGWSDVNVYPCIDYVGLAELKKKYESEKENGN